MSSPAAHAAIPIRVEGATRRYGDFCALDNVDLEVRGGEFLTLLGPSGSGKTTLLNILAGFTHLDAGRVRFGADDVTSLAPHKRNVGIVFQQYALFPHLDVFGNVAFPLRIRHVPPAQIREKVQWALDLVQLGALGSRPVSALSGGQRQRVALARAIVFEPPIILMDEPLSALDKQLRERMQIELRRLHDRLGSTTVYVTHDQREALTMSDRVAVMSAGRILQLDAPRKLYEEPANTFVADFIGESTLIPVTRADLHTAALGPVLLHAARPLPAGDELFAAIRSEKLLLAGEPHHGEANRLDAVLEDVVFQGESVLLLAKLPTGHAVSMRRMSNALASTALPAAGSQVSFLLPRQDTVIVAAAR